MRCLRFAALLVAVAGCGDETAPVADAAPPPGFLDPGPLSFGDELGTAVIEAGGEILVGVPGDDGPRGDDGAEPVGLERAGAVLVIDAATLAPIAELRSATPRRGARFGTAIAVDGDLLAVGAPGDFNPDPDAEVRDSTGAVHLFTRSGTSWVPLGEPLVAEGVRVGDRFGYAVSLAGDRLLVGAPGDDRRGDSTGGLYVFVRSGDAFVPAF